MKIKLVIVSLLLAGVVTGCTPSYRSAEGKVLLPPELKHCSSYVLRTNDGSSLYVISCPDRSVTNTTRIGKHSTHSIVVE